jgi:hypothetical protein
MPHKSIAGLRPPDETSHAVVAAGSRAALSNTVAAHAGRRITVTTLVPALIIFAISLPVCARLVFIGYGPQQETTDYWLHIKLALEMLRKGAVPPHPLFHGLLLALIGGDNEAAAPGIAAVILAAALGARAWLTAGCLASSRQLSVVTMTVLCLALALAMPLPNWWNWPNVCRGQVAPNAWYNPTGIFAMPFALGLFMVAMRVLERGGSGSVGTLAAVMVLSLLAKPNYVLAFAPCLAVMLATVLLRAVREGRLTVAAACARFLVVFAPTCAVLGLQYLVIYSGPNPTGGRLLYTPMSVWNRFTREHVPAAIYLGIAFPAIATVLYPLEANRDRALVLAWSALAIAIVQCALFAESGDRIIHFNLSWGMMLGAYVLYVVSCQFLLRQKGLVRKCLAFSVLGLHVASGSVCLIRSLHEPWKAIEF